MNASKTASVLGRQAAASLRPRSSLPKSLKAAAATSRNAQSRTYTTSVARFATIAEDYDAYSLYGTPQESTQCDLGAIVHDPMHVEANVDVDYYGEEPVWSLATFEPFWKSLVESELEEESRHNEGSHLNNVELRLEMPTSTTSSEA